MNGNTAQYGISIAADALEPHDRYENDEGQSIVEIEVEVVWLDSGRTIALDMGYSDIQAHRAKDGLEKFDSLFDRLEELIDLRRRGPVGLVRYNLDRHRCLFLPDGIGEVVVQLPTDDEDAVEGDDDSGGSER